MHIIQPQELRTLSVDATQSKQETAVCKTAGQANERPMF